MLILCEVSYILALIYWRVTLTNTKCPSLLSRFDDNMGDAGLKLSAAIGCVLNDKVVALSFAPHHNVFTTFATYIC